LTASRAHWLVDPPASPLRVLAQTRYRQPVVGALVVPRDDGRLDVRFDGRAAGVAPGQAVVFYDDDRVLGGAWIDELVRG